MTSNRNLRTMAYVDWNVVRWGLPAATTIAFLLLLMHKSEFPVVLYRYSIDYAFLLILFGFNLGLLWRKSALNISYKLLIKLISIRFLLSLLVLTISVALLVDFVFSLRVPRSPTDWVILALLLGILIQVETLRNKPNLLLSYLALLASSIALGVILLELLFACFLIESLVPKTHREFGQVMAHLKLWPHPISVKKPAGTFRILGLSDSFGTAGGTISNYHYVLEDVLRRDVSSSIQLVNVSVPGYEPRHQVDILRFGMGYAPDLVIHGFFVGNDFSLLKHEIYVYRDIWIFWDPATPRFRPRHFLARYWIENTIRFHREKWRRQQELRHGIVKTLGNFSAGEYLGGQFDRMNVWGRPNSKDIDRMKEIFPVLDAIRSRVEENGVRYVMVIHPDETQVNDKLRQEILTTFQVKEDEYSFDLPQKVLSAYCEERRIACLDLLPEFRAKAKQGDLYLLRDSHYNQAGNELAAASISEFLQANQLLPGNGQSGTMQTRH